MELFNDDILSLFLNADNYWTMSLLNKRFNEITKNNHVIKNCFQETDKINALFKNTQQVCIIGKIELGCRLHDAQMYENIHIQFADGHISWGNGKISMYTYKNNDLGCQWIKKRISLIWKLFPDFKSKFPLPDDISEYCCCAHCSIGKVYNDRDIIPTPTEISLKYNKSYYDGNYTYKSYNLNYIIHGRMVLGEIDYCIPDGGKGRWCTPKRFSIANWYKHIQCMGNFYWLLDKIIENSNEQGSMIIPK